jgi:hypothetical protein
MTTISHQTAHLRANQAMAQPRLLRTLLWHEWFSHGSFMLTTLSVWLLCQWVLMIFFHPGWVIGLGTVLGLWIGASFAGVDAQEGTQEFALALPPARAQRYCVRLGMGLSFLLLLVGISLLAISFGWPQALWGLLVETGFTGTYPTEEYKDLTPNFFYWLGLSCPLAAFGVSFGLGAMATTREQVTVSGLMGLLFTLGAAALGLRLESWLYWERLIGISLDPGRHLMNGGYAHGLLVAVMLVYLAAGLWGYVRKDGIARPRGSMSPEWKAGIALAGALLLLMVMVPIVLAVLPRRW